MYWEFGITYDPYDLHRPEGYKHGFIIKKTLANSTDVTEEQQFEPEDEQVTFNDVVRVMVSYDMGWSTRGSGRSYHSLNGYGAIIGHQLGLVLDY